LKSLRREAHFFHPDQTAQNANDKMANASEVRGWGNLQIAHFDDFSCNLQVVRFDKLRKDSLQIHASANTCKEEKK